MALSRLLFCSRQWWRRTNRFQHHPQANEDERRARKALLIREFHRCESLGVVRTRGVSDLTNVLCINRLNRRVYWGILNLTPRIGQKKSSLCEGGVIAEQGLEWQCQARIRASRKMQVSAQRELRYTGTVRSLSQAVFHLAG
jgi:hypothetical protein